MSWNNDAFRRRESRRVLSRRTLLRGSLLLAAGSRVARIAAAATPGAVVRTPLGTLQGVQQDRVCVFRGVPFAEPPVGDLRFRATVPKRPWPGVLDATRFGPEPWQPGTPDVPKAEDCLQLNLWTPADAKPASLPVFVWIHGGGFTGGHAFEKTFDGTEFAQQGIVCITVAYRLGVFGFLDVAPLLGAEYAGSANNALCDLITALEWVQANVASFGGDPGRVTIGGESAGAKLSDILMGIPAAQPLFHSVISESGGAERVWPVSTSRGIAEGFGKTWQGTSAQPVTALRTAAPATLITAQEEFIQTWPQHFPLRCQLDGKLLPRLPVETIAAGSTRGKRLLLGTNRDESALFLGPHPAKDPTANDLGNLSLAAFNAVFAKYAALYPDLSPEQRRIRATTAEEYWVPSMRVAAAHVRGGGSAWVYELDYSDTAGRFAGEAYHSEDIKLVWDRTGGPEVDRAAEQPLAAQMHTAWAAFIRGETPAAPGLPTWPQWTPARRETMLLDRSSTIATQPQEAELRLWDGVL